MRLLFVIPPIGAWATHGNHKAPNQFYAQLAAYVRQKGLAEVEVLDCRALELNYPEMVNRVQEMRPDMVVLGDLLHSTGGLAVIWHFNETARLIKQASPKTLIAVGGLWYSAFYQETMELVPAIDFIMIGEAELTLEDLLTHLYDSRKSFRDIPGLVSRGSYCQVHVGPHRSLMPDLDILPLPAYDLFPMDKYVGHTYWKPFAELLTSRGCPGGCHFCYEWSLYDPRSNIKDFTSWRSRSAKSICDEFDLLEKTYGVRVVVIQDDAFNVNADLVGSFCEEKISRGNQIKWVCLGRADDWTRQKDLIPLMARAGLFMGLVGIEVEKNIKLIKIGKRVTLEQIKETVDVLRDNRVATVGTVLLGLEDDDEATIKERLRVADQVDPDILALDYVTPVPGSPIWRQAIQNGFLKPKEIHLKEWDFHHPVIPTRYLSIEDLGRLGAWCMREFFSKPERIHRIMESDYDILVKLCVKDFMSNIAKFEAASKREKTYV